MMFLMTLLASACVLSKLKLAVIDQIHMQYTVHVLIHKVNIMQFSECRIFIQTSEKIAQDILLINIIEI